MAVALSGACQPTEAVQQCAGETSPQWQVLTTCLEHQLLGVWGSGPDDVWAVGGGGTVLRYADCKWTRQDTGMDQALWWVFGFADGPVFVVGEGGLILRDSGSGFEAMDSGTTVTLFGVWGAAPNDVWAVGFDPKGAAPSALLHYDGDAWSSVVGLPVGASANPRYFKVWGSGPDDVWVVGGADLMLHWDGTDWTTTSTGTGEDWVTVAGAGDLVVTVGGQSNGALAERLSDGSWDRQATPSTQLLQGVCVQPDGSALATGLNGTFLSRDVGGSWRVNQAAPFDVVDPRVDPCSKPVPDYHACWADGRGGYFVVGGDFLGGLTQGVLLYYGPRIPAAGL